MTRRRLPPVAVALGAAVLFHLSMVSVFSIVIYVPRTPVRYASLEVVKQERKAPRPLRGQLRLRAASRFIRPEPMPPAMPPVELPALALPKLEDKEGESQRLEIRRQFSEFFEDKLPEPPDSWAVFTQELRNFGRTVTGIAPEPEPPPPAIRVRNVAPGFLLEVRWLAEPRRRALLFSPPVEGLWRLDSAQLLQPVQIIFQADASGKVTDVQAAVPAGAEVAAQLQDALRLYRFEPLDGDAVHRGVLVLSAEARAE